MTLAFAPDACAQHPSRAALVAAALALALAGCPPSTTVSLEARPSGTYGEVLSFAAAGGRGRHTVSVEIELDEAQLLGWSKTTHAYAAFLDVRAEGGGFDPVEEIVPFPITEEREVGRDASTVRIAYLAAGTVQPSGFRLVPRRRALSFVPGDEPIVLSVHLRTPAGADRKALKAIRTVRLVVSGGEGIAQGWEARPPTVRRE